MYLVHSYGQESISLPNIIETLDAAVQKGNAVCATVLSHDMPLSKQT